MIAITGISCRFAGCPGPSAFWRTILARESKLSELDSEVALAPDRKTLFGNTFPARIGRLGSLYSCQPMLHNFPRQVNAGENQDLYFATQLAFEALADAGMRAHSSERVRGTVRVGYAPPFNGSTVAWLQHTTFLDQTMDILGSFMRGASREALEVVREKLVESLPAPDAASFLLGTGYRFASWIARECSFSGAATVIDAGMLTGAAALMAAVDDLNSGRADVALCGAVNPPLSSAYLDGLSGEVRFSTGTQLYPFSNAPEGTIPGEGGAFFVLKRREDALRDRDRIYALVKGVAIGHNPADDPSAIFSEALETAQVAPRTVQLIEATAGNGIPESELREVDCVNRLWGEHKPGGPLVGIGSVIGNIGNTLRASMSAGLVKAALALAHRVLPPQVETPVPGYGLSSLASSAYLLVNARPWITGDSSNLRRAVVTGANFDAVNPIGKTDRGGRAAAVVLEEEPEDRS